MRGGYWGSTQLNFFPNPHKCESESATFKITVKLCKRMKKIIWTQRQDTIETFTKQNILFAIGFCTYSIRENIRLERKNKREKQKLQQKILYKHNQRLRFKKYFLNLLFLMFMWFSNFIHAYKVSEQQKQCPVKMNRIQCMFCWNLM